MASLLCSAPRLCVAMNQQKSNRLHQQINCKIKLQVKIKEGSQRKLLSCKDFLGFLHSLQPLTE